LDFEGDAANALFVSACARARVCVCVCAARSRLLNSRLLLARFLFLPFINPADTCLSAEDLPMAEIIEEDKSFARILSIAIMLIYTRPD